MGEHLIVIINPLTVFWSNGMPEVGNGPIPTGEFVPGDPFMVLGFDLVAAAIGINDLGDRHHQNAQLPNSSILIRADIDGWPLKIRLMKLIKRFINSLDSSTQSM